MNNFICSLNTVIFVNIGLIIFLVGDILMIKMNEKEIADRIVGGISTLKNAIRLLVLSIIVFFVSVLLNKINWLAWILLIIGAIIVVMANSKASNIKLSRQ